MLLRPPRVALRAVRPLRPRHPVHYRPRGATRPQSTTAQHAAPSSSGAVAGGIAGGTVALLGGYLWYHVSGTRSVVTTLKSAKSSVDAAFKKTTEAAPEPSQAVQWLRETVSSYTKMIPGASKYVDAAFEDLDKVRAKHGDEVDDIINDTYRQLKDVTKAGFSVEAVTKAWDVLQDCFKRVSSLAADAAEDILDNHPQLKDKVGGSMQQLKQMGDQYGPEAKKKVDETWQQVQNILKGGIGVGTIAELQKLIQDKTQELKKFGDEAWQKGMEQAKPLLDKQPQLKELIETNKQKLLQGDLGQLWRKVQDAARSGNSDDLQDFVKDQVQRASAKGGSGIEQLLQMMPGGSEIAPKLRELQELSQKHGQEAEKVVRSAVDDIKKVLSQKVEEAEKLKDKVEKDAKRS